MGRKQRVADFAVGGLVGLFSREHNVQRSSQCINICPCADTRGVVVLLNGRIAGLQNDIDHLVGVVSQLCGAEIEQLNANVVSVADEDIIGSYVAVNYPRFMQGDQRFSDLVGDFDSKIPIVDPAVLFEIIAQRQTAQQLHDDVGGAVFFKGLKHVRDIAVVAEFRHCSRFRQKSFLAVLKFLHRFFIDNDLVLSDRSGHQAVRKKFLDRDNCVELGVPRAVDHAEAAGADRVAEQIAVPQKRAGR